MDLYLGNIPFTANAQELVEFLEAKCGKGNVFSCDIKTENGGFKSKGYGFVKFETESAADFVLALARSGQLIFKNKVLKADASRKVMHRPKHEKAQVKSGNLFIGNLASDDSLEYLWSPHTQVKAEVVYENPPRLRMLMKIGEMEYKMEFPFQSLSSVESCVIHGSRNRALLFQLFYPPRIYLRKPYEEDSTDLSSLLSILLTRFSYSKEDDGGPPWVRTTDFTPERAVGQSIVFCLEFPGSTDDEIKRILKKFADYHLGDYPPLFKKTKLAIGRFYASHQEVVPILWCTDDYNLPLELIFKVNYLVQDGYISPAGLSREFFSLLDPSRNSLENCLSALLKFERARKTCWDPVSKMKDYLQRKNRPGYMGAIKLDEGQVYVKRLIVTPSKAYFLGPEIEVSNRVTRRYSHTIDHFLRVSFTEEDYDTLPSTALSLPRKGGAQAGLHLKHSDVYKRILAVLQEGVKFGGKHFQFLAFSSSQLRENACWMFADDEDTTADRIRGWMGDFLSIRNVAKCAARMGQSFSSSTHTLNVLPHEVCHMRDIEKEVDGVKYCFSDGIGTISKAFAKEVASKCRAPVVPSAFQIRYGGYKGVVAVDPSSCFNLSLRPSMSKFPSSQTGLDVLSWTRYIPCYLNRQVIILLSTLGVEDDMFERMQAKVVGQLDRMLDDPVTALEAFQALYAGESHKFIVQMLLAGYSPSTEPYLRSLLQAFRASQLFLLRTKSRIFVPQGRCLMGCLDETAVLEYGQCFVQVSPTPGSNKDVEEVLRSRQGVGGRDRAFVVKGLVVVAKNPCLHPGDVLVLDAIDVPELHHMVDCIVFPQRGQRPHPNECSGSDLDGDLYFVSWDKSLLPSSREQPMSYEPAPAKELDHPVSLQEIQEFFLDHMANDSLGVIANAHLVHADTEPAKARDAKCIELARLFSVAVDFPKTGVPAMIPMNLRPRSYPDFMEKDDKTLYPSQTVIGKMYRSIKDHHFEGVSPLDPCDEYDNDLIMGGYERHLNEAFFYKECYDGKLMGLMNQYDVSEAEIMSGSMLSLSSYYRKRQGNTKERIILAAKSLVKEARGWFDHGGDTGNEEKAKAYAWYHVTYDPGVRRLIDRKEQLLSFPWVVYDKLMDIKKMANENGRMYVL